MTKLWQSRDLLSLSRTVSRINYYKSIIGRPARSADFDNRSPMEKKTKEQLREKANLLPTTPGVYIMHGAGDKIIYVGKSKALKNRVSQYFSDTAKDAKTTKMVSSVWDFEYMLTDTEIEALVLENKLIKLHTPKYNILLKDAKSYPYIKVTVKDEYPRIMLSRKRENDGARYFGPYSGAYNAASVIKTVSKLFGIPTCKHKFPNDIGKVRPCLYSHIGQCCGVCTGNITPEDYRERIPDVINVLKGSYSEVKKTLKEKMLYASKNLMFEAAASYRDRISALESLWQKQKVIGSPDAQFDIIAFHKEELCSCLAVYYVREGAVTDSDNFVFGASQISDDYDLTTFIADLYSRREFVPKNILIGWDMSQENTELLETYFKQQLGSAVSVKIPKIGENKKLCDMVLTNAKNHAKQYIAEREKDESVLFTLADMLSLEVIPESIEAIDISNLSSEHITAGLIRVDDSKFNKSGYRTYKIRSTEGQDDYKAMCEALERRFSHKDDQPLPDLLLLDGGKGHVGVVKSLMQRLAIDIPVFGMVKDDFHKTRALTDGVNEISIAREQSVFVFIYKIQEEVHRYTVGRMQNAKRKTLKHSKLEEIPGIGNKKAQILLRAFGSMTAVKNATYDELVRTNGINSSDAMRIVSYFEKKSEDT